jgi:hypothetical protein
MDAIIMPVLTTMSVIEDAQLAVVLAQAAVPHADVPEAQF